MSKKRFLHKLAASSMAAMLLLCLYFLIFSFSGQDGQTSGNLSHLFSEKCVDIINTLAGGKWTEGFAEGLVNYFEHPIRKLAHFAEYACMGVLVFAVWRPWRARNWRLYLLVVVWVLLSAAGDELHQLFVPGRSGNPADVLLDTCGGCFGLFCCVAAEKCFYRTRTV